MRPDESETAAVRGAGASRTRRVLSGEGMLAVVRTFTEGDDRFIAGKTYVAPDHPTARRYPERFTPAMDGDTTPAVERFRSLQRSVPSKHRTVRLHGEPLDWRIKPNWRLR